MLNVYACVCCMSLKTDACEGLVKFFNPALISLNSLFYHNELFSGKTSTVFCLVLCVIKPHEMHGFVGVSY